MLSVLVKTVLLISTNEMVFGTENKRLLLHDAASLADAYQNLAAEVNALKTDANAMKTEMTSLKSTVATLQSYSGTGGGSLYVRWGRTSCPTNGTTLVYSGLAAGASYSGKGGGADYLCLPTDQQWAYCEDTVHSPGRVYGVEYEFGTVHSNQGSAFFGGKKVYDEDAPCAVCQSTRPLKLMLPGRLDCYPVWTRNTVVIWYLMLGDMLLQSTFA